MPSFLNAGFSFESTSDVVSARTDFIAIDHDRIAFALRDGDQQDLVGEGAIAIARAAF